MGGYFGVRTPQPKGPRPELPPLPARPMGVLEKRRHRIFMTRSSGMYRKLNQRHAKVRMGPMLESLDQFRSWIMLKMGTPCPYCCAQELKVRNFSPDHAIPLDRGGAGTLGNLVVCCSGCNKAKGPMTADEFNALIREISVLSHAFQNPNIKRHVLMSLKIASSFRFGSDRRAKKARGAA